MSLLELLIEYCVSNGALVGDGVDSFRNFMPEAPDDIVVFHEYASDAPLPSFTEHVHRSVQVRVRGTSDEIARSKALELYKLFIAETEDLKVDFSVDTWGQVYIRQLPFKFDQDKSNRVIYCFNLGITTNIIE